MGDFHDAIKKVVKTKWAKPINTYKMTFESPQTQLEPIYYWILDFVQDAGWDVKKIVDNFTSSPGSGHFAEMNQRATTLHQEATRILGGINQIIKSILTLIHDLKEFDLRLQHYEDAKSDDKQRREAGILALKQIWLDNVDSKRGRGSIHSMAYETGFTTIREVFMIANSLDDLEKMRKEGKIINEQIERILKPRIKEFFDWVKLTEKELRKRKEIEKTYLRSQVETLKLYSSWLKPYLESAERLRQQGFEGDAALVNAFSTTKFQLTLFGKKAQKLPEKFSGYNLKRKYYACILIDFKYRGHVGQRVTQRGDYAFALGGRVDLKFECYALNEDELKFIEKESTKDDIAEIVKAFTGIADDALKELKEDLDHYLGNEEEKKEEKEKPEDINPFSALFSLFKKSKKEEKKPDTPNEIRKDNYIEKELRKEAAKSAAKGLYIVYDIYKKAHGLASAPGDGFDPI